MLVVLGIGAAIGVFFYVGSSDPDSAAKVKCEFGIEEATGLSVGIRDVARATVTGDEFNGRVQMRFNAGATPYVAECVFEHGLFQTIMLNGEIVAGR